MKQVIIIETSQPQQVKKLLEQACISYRFIPNSRKSLFVNYKQAIQDQARESEAQKFRKRRGGRYCQ